MNTADIATTLVEATLASSVAILLVLPLRQPLRAHFGATVGYAAWLLVPAALVAVLLPAAIAPTPVMMFQTLAAAMPQPLATEPLVRIDWMPLGLWAWSFGALVAVVCFALQQRRFRRALGRLQARADGLQQASSTRGLPAAFGLLRPRIVVPADFDRRYSVEQQALMHAHERSHICSGDLHVNALVAALRCLLWFNPLLYIAARHFRHDQELACDQRVIAQHPRSRRAYGEAMFKTQLAEQPLPVGCHWGYGHPLKERIAMLKQPVPTRSRRTIGVALMAGLALLTGTVAWAAQPARTVAPSSAPSSVSGDIGTGVDGVPMPPLPPPPPSASPAPAAPVDPQLPAPPPPPPPPPPAPPAPSAPPAHPALRAPPAYPAAAVELKISGMVVLVIDIDARGNPVDIEVERSEPVGVFDQAAVDAAKQWKFSPEVEDGKPVASRVRVPVEFKIPPAKAGSAAPAGVAMVALSTL